MQDTFVSAQLVTMGLTVALGFFMGICFELFNVLRYFMHVSRPLQFVLDLCFWLCMTVFTFAVLLFNNWLEIRAYVFFGLGVGVILYLIILRRLWRRLLIFVIEKLLFLGRWLMQPFFWLAAKLKAIFQFCSLQSKRLKKLIGKITLNLQRQKKE